MTAPLAVESQSGMLLRASHPRLTDYRSLELKTLASKRVILLGNGA